MPLSLFNEEPLFKREAIVPKAVDDFSICLYFHVGALSMIASAPIRGQKTLQ